MKKPTLKKYEGKSQEDCLKYQRYLTYSFRRIAASSKKYVDKLNLNKTPSELYFEKCLKSWEIDFQAQYVIIHPTFTYTIADYYLPKYHTLIELDGSIHNDPEILLKDKLKESMVKAIGFPCILRIKNEDISGLSEDWLVNYLTNLSQLTD